MRGKMRRVVKTLKLSDTALTATVQFARGRPITTAASVAEDPCAIITSMGIMDVPSAGVRRDSPNGE